MPATLLDGKEIAKEIRSLVADQIAQEKITPGLGVILVSGNPASDLYVSLKEKAAKEVGVMLNKYIIDDDATTEQVIEAIQFLNTDPDTNGIIVQLPLPDSFDTGKIIDAIDPKKDVDGFHPENLKRNESGEFTVVPVIGKTILATLEKTGIETNGKHVVILSNSDVFAQPIAPLLESLHCTVERTSLDTTDWADKIQMADILISAVGKPHIITKDMIKQGAVIIDIGVTKEGQNVYGDVDPNVDEVAAFRTPVPGGIGPITVAMLLSNTVELYKQQNN